MKTETPLLTEREWMLFVDGENFTKRGQDVLKKARTQPVAGERWQRDVFLWLPYAGATDPVIGHTSWSFHRMNEPYSPPPPSAHAASRAYYYTSMPYESADAVTETRLRLREIGFEPRMFPRRQGKSKAVDLALATDVLTLAGEGRYEVAVIVAGDADYVPVIEATKRLGRHVVLAFFGEPGAGLSDELRIAADDFVDLGGTLTHSWRQLHEMLDREAANRAAKTPTSAEP